MIALSMNILCNVGEHIWLLCINIIQARYTIMSTLYLKYTVKGEKGENCI